jgi:hypothetical protein
MNVYKVLKISAQIVKNPNNYLFLLIPTSAFDSRNFKSYIIGYLNPLINSVMHTIYTSAV